MQQYSKAIAAGASGTILVIISAVIKGYFPDFNAKVWTPEVQAAVQTLVTGISVYLSPANTPQ